MILGPMHPGYKVSDSKRVVHPIIKSPVFKQYVMDLF